MKRNEPQPLYAILEDIKRRQHLETRLLEAEAAKLWDNVAGSAVAAQTTSRYVSRGVLALGISSAPLRQELSMRRSVIVSEINRMAGAEVIHDIRFI